jgi:AcrR family transcriptional regulator
MTDDAQKQRGRPRDEKAKEAIERATREMMLDSGYSNLTIEGVAESAGVAKTTIYRWWPSKAALVLDAAAQALEIGIVPDTGNTREDLTIAVRQLVDTFSDPLAGSVILSVVAHLEADPWMAVTFRDRWVYPWRQSASEALKRAVDRGDLPSSSDLPLLLDVMVGTVFQRAVTVAEPNVEGLESSLADLILGR